MAMASLLVFIGAGIFVIIMFGGLALEVYWKHTGVIE